MMTIGLLSDTHAHLDSRFKKFFEPCDEIWHAGDIGSLALSEELENFKPFRAVFGNIDDYLTRKQYPEFLRFTVEDVNVFMTHIGGYPNRYQVDMNKVLQDRKPDLFVCGHSHILRVMYDKKYNWLVMNPGAAGLYGQQTKRTALRFKISGKEISDLEIFELER